MSYPPLNTLKPVAEDIWIVDGPAIKFGIAAFKFDFPTRMTVVRLGDGSLFIHSPTPVPAPLQRQIDNIGKPAWLIGPNRIHYWWIRDWKAAYPHAQAWLAPGIKEQGGSRVDFDYQDLAPGSSYPWDTDIASVAVPGSYMTEFAFFDRPSRSLILTDLIENFEPQKISMAMRLLGRVGGVLDPDGQTPRDMRLSLARHKRAVQQAVHAMLAWNPERVILAHGRWYDHHGADELRRALRWVLE